MDLIALFNHYLFSLYENSLLDLALFLSVLVLLFISRHLWINARIRSMRAELPLVIGGWGTRGKSGTERIKAALMNALGYGIVSKTTGCEAMFLYAPAFGQMCEMPLFRPYDKATIWEQADVMDNARRLKADVLLWECMGLTPAYVKVLQRDWARDDFSTITNAFPDHEDLQGPAGHDVARVISDFIPARSTVFSTEEQMLPILKQVARERGTTLHSANWLEAGLIPHDILERFPYDEHPYNIALVLQLAAALDIPEDFALKEMADRVVPDLGVLKAYPIASVQGRRLEFINGMSANERFGALSNWQRIGFDQRTADPQPGVWISTVVNNRADRVARSRVFADILVKDINADTHFLIGDNLNGLLRFIEEAWAEHAVTLSLWPMGGGDVSPEQRLEAYARRYGIATDEAILYKRLQAMLPHELAHAETVQACVNDEAALTTLLHEKKPPHMEAILLHHARHLREYRDYAKLAEQVGKTTAPDHCLDAEMRTLIYAWFRSRIVVIDDYWASGDKIIHEIAEATPPGYLNHIMGTQNIKGTGLDFVYRWQAWEGCHEICQRLRNPDPNIAEEAAQELAAFKEYNLACKEYVHETLHWARSNNVDSAIPSLLAAITENLDSGMEAAWKRVHARHERSGITTIMQWLEEALDASHAVQRRKTADRIYRDLADERIGIDRAMHELKALNRRQNGGWLEELLLLIVSHCSKQSIKLPFRKATS